MMQSPPLMNIQPILLHASSPPMLNKLKALAESVPSGAFVEVGVHNGNTAVGLYEVAIAQGRELYLYDTFSGMPYSGWDDHHQIGEMSDCSVQTVITRMPKAHVIEGVFPASAVPMPPIAFVHADADQYESTAGICRHFPPLMVPGGQILFDDYRCLRGCIRAVDEYFPGRVVLDDGRALVTFG